MPTKVFKVAWSGFRWELRQGDAAIYRHRKRELVVGRGEQVAFINAPSQLLVLRQDGSLEIEHEYGVNTKDAKASNLTRRLAAND